MTVVIKRAWWLLILLLSAVIIWFFGRNSKPLPDSVSAVASAPVAVSAMRSSAPVEPEESEDDRAQAAQEAKENLALFFGEDDRVFIPSPYPGAYAAIGKMQTVSESHCTATLVAPDLAVTAAHCFLMQPRKLDKGQWFWTGYHDGQWQARYQVVGQVFHPKFRKGLQYKGEDVYILPSVSAYDIAWLKLKLVDGVPPQPMQLFSGSDTNLLALIERQDRKVTQAGFAHDHNQRLTAHRDCKVTAVVEDNTLEHQCDTLSGASGSPLWLETEQGPLLVAVQSAAPDWFNRDKADNTAVSVLQLPKLPK